MTEEWIETRIGQAPSRCNGPRRDEAVAAMLGLTDLGWARNESRLSWRQSEDHQAVSVR